MFLYREIIYTKKGQFEKILYIGEWLLSIDRCFQNNIHLEARQCFRRIESRTGDILYYYEIYNEDLQCLRRSENFYDPHKCLISAELEAQQPPDGEKYIYCIHRILVPTIAPYNSCP